MDKIAEYKEQIYDMAIEKQAGVFSALKGIGTAVGEMGLGKKMLTGAGIGGALGMMKQPAEGQDRLSNAVSGAFGGATLGATVHGVTSGLKGLSKNVSAPKPDVIIPPAPTPKLQLQAPKVNEVIPHYNYNEGITPPQNFTDVKFKEAFDIIENLYQEKIANALGEIVEDGVKATGDVIKGANPNSLGNKAKRFYNHTLGANTLKTTVTGAGIGAAAGAMGYKEDQDDGSFEHSRFGAMTSGALAGGGAGLATGLMFKPIKGVPKVPKFTSAADEAVKASENVGKTASYKDVIYDIAMEKHASAISAVAKGATGAFDEFKKMDRLTQMAIGSSIGGAVGLLTGLQRDKDKDIATKEKVKSIGENVFKSALIGGSLAGITTYKPGQLKKDFESAKDAIMTLKKEGVL